MELIEIIDPVYESYNIEEDDEEYLLISRLLKCPEMKRLTYLKQANISYFHFPGSTHSRYAHAFGSYILARIARRNIRVREKNGLKKLEEWLEKSEEEGGDLKEEDLKLEFILALFLHDLGNLPFSHVLEQTELKKEGLDHELITKGLLKGENWHRKLKKFLIEQKLTLKWKEETKLLFTPLEMTKQMAGIDVMTVHDVLEQYYTAKWLSREVSKDHANHNKWSCVVNCLLCKLIDVLSKEESELKGDELKIIGDLKNLPLNSLFVRLYESKETIEMETIKSKKLEEALRKLIFDILYSYKFKKGFFYLLYGDFGILNLINKKKEEIEKFTKNRLNILCGLIGEEIELEIQDGETVKKVKQKIKLLSKLIKGAIDLDRIDHYSRDSMYSGVKLAEFNLISLLSNIIVNPEDRDGTIEISRDGLANVFRLLDSRDLIWVKMLDNPHVRFYEQLLVEAIEKAIVLKPSLRLILPFVSDDILLKILTVEFIDIPEVTKLVEVITERRQSTLERFKVEEERFSGSFCKCNYAELDHLLYDPFDNKRKERDEEIKNYKEKKEIPEELEKNLKDDLQSFSFLYLMGKENENEIKKRFDSIIEEINSSDNVLSLKEKYTDCSAILKYLLRANLIRIQNDGIISYMVDIADIEKKREDFIKSINEQIKPFFINKSKDISIKKEEKGDISIRINEELKPLVEVFKDRIPPLSIVWRKYYDPRLYRRIKNGRRV